MLQPATAIRTSCGMGSVVCGIGVRSLGTMLSPPEHLGLVKKRGKGGGELRVQRQGQGWRRAKRGKGGGELRVQRQGQGWRRAKGTGARAGAGVGES